MGLMPVLQSKEGQRSSKAYWISRNLDRLDWLAKNENKLLDKQKKIYKRAVKELEAKMDALYQELYLQAKLGEDLRYIDLYQYKKYQAIREQLKASFTGIAKSQIDGLTDMIDTIYRQEIAAISAELGKPVSFDHVFDNQVKQAVESPFMGKHFSARIWDNTSLIANKIEGDIHSMLTWGKNPNDIKQGIIDRFGNSFYEADRLVRTESIHAYNSATMTGYRRSGVVQHYEYYAATDERTCEICGGLHEKIFAITEAQEGVNYPVTHPNCRCTTIPVIN